MPSVPILTVLPSSVLTATRLRISKRFLANSKMVPQQECGGPVCLQIETRHYSGIRVTWKAPSIYILSGGSSSEILIARECSVRREITKMEADNWGKPFDVYRPANASLDSKRGQLSSTQHWLRGVSQDRHHRVLSLIQNTANTPN
jgi:hypothetical protein